MCLFVQMPIKKFLLNFWPLNRVKMNPVGMRLLTNKYKVAKDTLRTDKKVRVPLAQMIE
jgi:hypothetical protein